MAIVIPPGTKGVDYSWARPDPVQLYADGVRYAARYVGPDPKSGKVVTPDEVRRLHAAGIGVPIVYEANAVRPYSGRPGGTIDGAVAATYCRDVLHMPARYPIMVAFDTDTTPGNIDIFEAYGRAFYAACWPYLFGIYGDRDIIERLADISSLGWQANASWWSRLWSKLDKSPNVHIQQLSQSPDHTVDYNISRLPFTAWDGRPEVVPVPVPVPVPQEGDMAIRFITLGVEAGACFFAEATASGVVLNARWSGDGADPKVADRIAAHRFAGMTDLPATLPDLLNVNLLGPLPVGDPLHNWTGDEFANTDEITAPSGVDSFARAMAAGVESRLDGLLAVLRNV